MDPTAREEMEPLNSTGRQVLDDASSVVIKPICEWTQNDFLDLPSHPSNQLLRMYSQLLERLWTVVSSPGSLMGLLLQILVLVGDIIFVAFAANARRMETEADIRLLWISVIFWLLLLWSMFKRLILLGKERGGYFQVFVFLEKRVKIGWKKFCKMINSFWNKTVCKWLSKSQNIQVIRRRIRKM